MWHVQHLKPVKQHIRISIIRETNKQNVRQELNYIHNNNHLNNCVPINNQCLGHGLDLHQRIMKHIPYGSITYQLLTYNHEKSIGGKTDSKILDNNWIWRGKEWPIDISIWFSDQSHNNNKLLARRGSIYYYYYMVPY